MKKNQEISYQKLVKLTSNFIPESYEEYVFACWVATLMEKGYITKAFRPESISINKKVDYEFTDSKGKTKTFTLVRDSSYQADLEIHWADKAHGLLFIKPNDLCYANPSPLGSWCKSNFLFYADNCSVSIVDVKGTFTPSNNIPFSRTQQLCAMIDLYIQKVIPLGNTGLFMKTFAPSEHLYTPATKKRRSKFKDINEWEQYNESILIEK